jgi:large subunit ribosomal protein L22
LVAGAIRGLSVSEALVRLPVIYKGASPLLIKLLKSAAANALDQYDIKEEDLLIKSVMVNKGIDLKRWQPAAFGRAHPFKKHFSHIELVLTAKEGVQASRKQKKQEVETVKLSDLSEIDKEVADKKTENKSGKSTSKKLSVNKTGARIDKHTTNK